MSGRDKYILRGKITIAFSIIIIAISCGIDLYLFDINNKIDYKIGYESINVKDMATANIAVKKEKEKSGISEIINTYQKMVHAEVPKEISLPSIDIDYNVEENTSLEEEQKRIWYLPCEIGNISSSVTYSHYALDITSPRGQNEVIYPVADGIISSIYTDRAGALIVTINHNIDGKLYTSQYVHMSRYADGIFVGKNVSPSDPIGYMGRTGIATGVHLHFALVDCGIFNDENCSNLGGFFNYGKRRLTEGFYGLQSVMDVPSNWTNR